MAFALKQQNVRTDTLPLPAGYGPGFLSFVSLLFLGLAAFLALLTLLVFSLSRLQSATSQIAFQRQSNPSDRPSLALMDVNRNILVSLYQGNSYENRSLAWSPNGRQLAFVSEQGGVAKLFLIDANGQNVRQLTPQLLADGSAISWSPDGSRILFSSFGGVNNDLYVTDVGQGTTSRLTNFRGRDMMAVWSPDGRQIAFLSNHGEDLVPVFRVYVMNADGGDARPVTNNLVFYSPISWSPDSKQIAFTSFQSGSGDIYVVNADGSGTYRVTSDDGLDINPVWSPDGQQIVFWMDSGGMAVHAVNSDGTNLRQLTDTFTRCNDDYLSLAWSAQSGQILVSIITVTNGSGIYIAQADGGPARYVFPNSAYHADPVWQP